MRSNKLKNPPKLPELSGAHLLGRICLHPSQSSRIRLTATERRGDEGTEVTAQPPSEQRLREEARGRRYRLTDRFSSFLTSHPGDRPWRRAEGELPLWDPAAALSNKAAILTAKIASDFCAWYRGLGGEPVIDEETVQQMFDIHFPEPARSATKVQIRELPRRQVPNTVLERLSLLQTTEELPPPKAESPPVPRVAFGRCLPRSESCSKVPCRAPPLPRPPPGLLEMQPVFEDITELDITQGYCEMLREQPDLPKPAYLVKQGLVPPAAQALPRRSRVSVFGRSRRTSKVSSLHPS